MVMMLNFDAPIINQSEYSPMYAKGGRRGRRSKRNRTRRNKRSNKSRTRRYR